MKTVLDIKNEAHKVLFKFQQGSINKEQLYIDGVSLALQFNEALKHHDDSNDVESTACLLYAIKMMSTS
ncbi:hypothetical protein J9M50_004134 [Salmonella enterica]|nr:hypothetical protein [Salmonella enterica]EHI9910540.1 hypothetical protein [Salmonella enterica]EHJ0911245.1 hypothetical protein [Salmonella enterica]